MESTASALMTTEERVSVNLLNKDTEEDDLPVYGYPGTNFYVIHISALISLSISIVVSSCVLIYLLTKKNLWKASTGERLVVYLSLCDLLFSISHTLDHSYMTAVVGHPPELACKVMAGFLLEFTTTQLLLVTFIATNAFLMVVKEKRIRIGKYDWKLLLGCFGTPAVLCVISASLDVLGPSGAWCFFDARKKLGVIAANIIAVTMIVVFVYNTLSYVAIWYKIRKVSKSTAAATSTNQKKYHRSAQTMLFFVAAFIGQWWAFIIYNLWSFFSDPHIVITVAAVIFSNMGGVFNFLSYTYIRKRQAAVDNNTSMSVTQTK